MRRIAAIIMATILVTSLAGCSGSHKIGQIPGLEEENSSQSENEEEETAGDESPERDDAAESEEAKDGGLFDSLFDGAVKISSAADLEKFRDQVNDGEDTLNAVLTADIDLSEVCGEGTGNWDPIYGYDGVFDGDGHTISGLYIVIDAETDPNGHAGLFRACGEESVIRNLTLDDVMIYVSNEGGAITSNSDGLIENCHVEGNVGAAQAGGIAAYGNRIVDCSFSGTVLGADAHGSWGKGTMGEAGGIAFSVKEVENCVNYGTVMTSDATESTMSRGKMSKGSCAGIAKVAYTTVRNCENHGAVLGYRISGGIVAELEGKQSGIPVENCTNTGIVVSGEGAGGIVGSASNITIDQCGNTGMVYGCALAGGILAEGYGNSLDVQNCYQIGTVATDYQKVMEQYEAVGLDVDVMIKSGYDIHTHTADGFTGHAGGIVGRATLGTTSSPVKAKVTNCYTSGTIYTLPKMADSAYAIAQLSKTDGTITNCSSTAHMTASLKYGIGSATIENCFFSEDTAEYSIVKSKGQPQEDSFTATEAAAFTDGTVAAALNEGVKSLGEGYSEWTTNADGPCFTWTEGMTATMTDPEEDLTENDGEEAESPAETTPGSETAEGWEPDYAAYHEIVDVQYFGENNSDYNVYTMADINGDGVLELVIEMGGREDAESYVDIYTLTADGPELLETQEYPCDWLDNADWVLTIDDTGYERNLQP